MTTAETAHRSEDERFSSEEQGSGAELTRVEGLWSSMVVEAMEEKKGKFTSIAGWKHSPEKMTRYFGWTLMS